MTRIYRTGLALMLLAASLAVGGWSLPAQPPRGSPPRVESLIDPFIITFDRHDDHVIVYEKHEVAGVPTLRLRFTSSRGEDIAVHYQALSAPSPELGGFINPGAHASGAALPVMWANASAYASPATVVAINGVPAELVPGPVPGSLAALGTSSPSAGQPRRQP